jgi:hypothetical protein
MLGCRACEQLTGGNCGAHGPTYIPILGSGPTGLPIMTPEFAAAAVHRLEQERLERSIVALCEALREWHDHIACAIPRCRACAALDAAMAVVVVASRPSVSE